MILFRDKTDVGGGVVRAGVAPQCPPQKDIRQKEEREGRVKNSYVTISDGA